MTSTVKSRNPTVNDKPAHDDARQTARDELDRLVDIVADIAERVERRSVQERLPVCEPDRSAA